MCFPSGKGSSTPPPPPAAAPIPTPADQTPLQTADQRRARIAALKFGALSTVKTSGLFGSGSNLSSQQSTGTKSTLGS